MGYTASFNGRINLEPAMAAEHWQRTLDDHPDYGAIDSGVRKILTPTLMPVLSDDRREVVAVTPGKGGCSPSVMSLVLRQFAHLAALANEDGGWCRFSGHFDGIGEDGTNFRVQMTNAALVATEEWRDDT
jgi:hypothetical protein